MSKNIDSKVILTEFGRIAVSEWKNTAEIRNNVKLDAYVIMPNHMHSIIFLTEEGTARRAPTEKFGKPVSRSIPTIIRSFKSAVTRTINQIRNSSGDRVWQRNYYEHIVRNENELNRIREYIVNNPSQWNKDIENPVHEPQISTMEYYNFAL